MNTNIVRLDRPYNIIMCDGELHEQIATLVTTQAIGKTIKFVSYPIIEDGTPYKKRVEELITLGKRGQKVDFRMMSMITEEYARFFPYSPFKELLNDLDEYYIRIDAPSESEYLIPIHVEETKDGIHIVEDTDVPYIHIYGKDSMQDALNALEEQLNGYRTLFNRRIQIRVQVDSGYLYKSYESYINRKMEEIENNEIMT